MNIRYCKRCNTVYKYGNMSYCSNCLDEVEDIMVSIRKYLEEHPTAGVSEISNGTGQSEKDILYLLREGRLSIKENSSQFLCARCGADIRTGKYCSKCIDEMKAELNGVVNDYKNKDSSKSDNNSSFSSRRSNGDATRNARMHTAYRRKN